MLPCAIGWVVIDNQSMDTSGEQDENGSRVESRTEGAMGLMCRSVR